MRAPPAGRPTQELVGDRPEERRAPTQELDRPLLFFNTVGTHVFILGLWQLRVRGRVWQWYNGLGLGISLLDAIGMVSRIPILSSAPLHRSRLLSTSSPWAPFQLQNQ